MSNREGRTDRLVWLDEESLFGEIIGTMGTYFTTVRYQKGGMEYEVLMENDEFTLMEDMYERDDD